MCMSTYEDVCSLGMYTYEYIEVEMDVLWHMKERILVVAGIHGLI